VLLKLGELKVCGWDLEVGRYWVIMPWHKEKHVIHTSAWEDFFGKEKITFNSKSYRDYQRCHKFLTTIYDKVIAAVDSYTFNYGMMRTSSNLNFGDVLFSNDLDVISLVDWGEWDEIGKRHLTGKEREDLFDYLSTQSQLPILDNDDAQGVCSSERRTKLAEPAANSLKGVRPCPKVSATNYVCSIL